MFSSVLENWRLGDEGGCTSGYSGLVYLNALFIDRNSPVSVSINTTYFSFTILSEPSAQWNPYMCFRTEESFFLPPLIPAGLHVIWTVGGRKWQTGICRSNTSMKVCRKTFWLGGGHWSRNSVTFLGSSWCLIGVNYLLFLSPVHCFSTLEKTTSLFRFM